MNQTLDFTVQLTTIHCGNCGGSYAISESYRDQKCKAGGFWHCPYCQGGWGYSESENSKLQKQVAQLQTTIERKEAYERELLANNASLERSRNAIRGAHARTCNRVKNGVCPCCNRTFQNLVRHMHTKHPDFKAAT